jgi:hypothetical protein
MKWSMTLRSSMLNLTCLNGGNAAGPDRGSGTGPRGGSGEEGFTAACATVRTYLPGGNGV